MINFDPNKLEDYLYENNVRSSNMYCLNAVNLETGQVSKDFNTEEEFNAFIAIFPAFNPNQPIQ